MNKFLILFFLTAQISWAQVKTHEDYLVLPVNLSRYSEESMMFVHKSMLVNPFLAVAYTEEEIIRAIRTNSKLSKGNKPFTIDPNIVLGRSDLFIDQNNYTFTGGFVAVFLLDFTSVLEIDGQNYLIHKLRYKTEKSQFIRGQLFNSTEKDVMECLVFRQLIEILPIRNQLIKRRLKYKYQLQGFTINTNR